jgi:hypothetical protein
LTPLQLVPLLVDRKMPPFKDPAKIFDPFAVKAWTEPPPGPPVCVHWAEVHWENAIRIPIPIISPVVLILIIRRLPDFL